MVVPTQHDSFWVLQAARDSETPPNKSIMAMLAPHTPSFMLLRGTWKHDTHGCEGRTFEKDVRTRPNKPGLETDPDRVFV